VERSWLQKLKVCASEASGLPDEDLGLPSHEPKVLSGRKGLYKQILAGQTGSVMPCELVAILGPSGSGKTSLLNVLGQRISYIQHGSVTTGTLMLNGRPFERGCYSNVGAYVQQDDVLCDALTIEELLTFSAKIRTSLTDEQVKVKV
jgi:ABC-type multidrug transport system ATPase subunit